MADLHGGGGMAAEFQEEEVWAMMEEAREEAAAASNSNSKTRKNFSTSSSSSSSSVWRFTAIPRSATSSGSITPTLQSSAPVSIPHWSKILKNQPKKKNTRPDDDGSGINFECMMKLGDDGDDDVRLPPHEYLARRLASSQVASFSMCEGVGRTLKGRDLSNLRNTILTKTGFLE